METALTCHLIKPIETFVNCVACETTNLRESSGGQNIYSLGPFAHKTVQHTTTALSRILNWKQMITK